MQEKKEWEAPKLYEIKTANTLHGNYGPGNDNVYQGTTTSAAS